MLLVLFHVTSIISCN